ncbi:Uncharacterised protein [Mycobacteroides abscessus subsp. abscessus]|nr:Uncharacterised protein [Mycobacteroides abscessus subsp. abscessus]
MLKPGKQIKVAIAPSSTAMRRCAVVVRVWRRFLVSCHRITVAAVTDRIDQMAAASTSELSLARAMG